MWIVDLCLSRGTLWTPYCTFIETESGQSDRGHSQITRFERIIGTFAQYVNGQTNFQVKTRNQCGSCVFLLRRDWKWNEEKCCFESVQWNERTCFSHKISKNCLKLSLLFLSNVHPHKCRPYSRCSLLKHSLDFELKIWNELSTFVRTYMLSSSVHW